MAFHWFTILCWSLMVVALLMAVIFAATEEKDAAGWFVLIAVACFFAGAFVGEHADDQNSGLGSRNKKEFTARGYKVVHAYGHTVCVAAGPYKLCLQERKDATGKKQLVMPTKSGGWMVVDQKFVNAVASAPNLTYPTNG